MVVLAFVLPILLIYSLAAASGALSQSRSSADCREWHACRQLALEAAERHEYETLHDLAWRTVQTGPQRDPALSTYWRARSRYVVADTDTSSQSQEAAPSQLAEFVIRRIRLH